MAVKFIALPMLVLLLFAVIAVIILFIKLCSKQHLVVGILALVPLVLFASYIVLGHRSAILRRPDVSMESSLPRLEETAVAIWQPGIEDEFQADVYSSRLSAVCSVGLRIAEPVRQVFGEGSPSRLVLFRGAHDPELVERFGDAVGHAFPGVQWTIAPETVAVQKDEVGIRLDLVKVQTHPTPWLSESEKEVTSGTIQASVLAAEKQASVRADFVEKPWVEDFSGFLNVEPKRRFVVAKSKDSCMTETEANHQAMQDACTQVDKMLGRASSHLAGKPMAFISQVNSDDLLEGGFILDRFVQSFKGTSGRNWRQALLIDASAERLTQLAQRKAALARAMRTSWMRLFFSVVGLLVLITVVYTFLNAATKGYYAWSLRIAGAVLAVVVIILLLT